MSRLALRFDQPPNQQVQVEGKAFSVGTKWLKHEANHSLLSSDEVYDVWKYTSTSPECLHDTGLGHLHITPLFNLCTCLSPTLYFNYAIMCTGQQK